MKKPHVLTFLICLFLPSVLAVQAQSIADAGTRQIQSVTESQPIQEAKNGEMPVPLSMLSLGQQINASKPETDPRPISALNKAAANNSIGLTSYWLLTCLLPGLGQVANGNRHGLIFTAAFETAAVYYYSLWRQYDEDIQVYNRIYKDFKANPSGTKMQKAIDFRKKMSDNYTAAQTGLYILGAIYAVNLIDALIIKTDVSAYNMSSSPMMPAGGLNMALNVRMAL